MKLESLKQFQLLNQEAMTKVFGGQVNGSTKETAGGSKPSAWCASSGCITYTSDTAYYDANGNPTGQVDYLGWKDCDNV